MTYIVIAGLSYQAETTEQIAEARKALTERGQPEAEVWAGEPDGAGDSSYRNGQKLFAAELYYVHWSDEQYQPEVPGFESGQIATDCGSANGERESLQESIELARSARAFYAKRWAMMYPNAHSLHGAPRITVRRSLDDSVAWDG